MSLLNFLDGLFGVAESSDAKCSENPQSLFKIFKWSGEHHYKQVGLICPWGALSWHKYEMQIECKLCGVTRDFFGVSEAKLVKHGVPLEKLAECRRKDTWVKVKQK